MALIKSLVNVSDVVYMTVLPARIAGVKKIVIFGDADPNYAGQMAAYALANRLYSKDYIVNQDTT